MCYTASKLNYYICGDDMKKIKTLSFLLLIISLVGILTACRGTGLGKNVVKMHSGSMEPTIPIGALVKYEEV